ncbi:iron ABC transporter ATP-binding protein [ANME-1 cluster archaeon ex4572_4]|nr:MAG: iron ABC transporter ATP-binding protein [ANME-1 cluster archaeon ex4572_4]PXF51928.1 MAG: ABC transporter ATP-binding protein [Methanophagales archaeon]HDN67967.1 ABC transporter ATP-binding protein [Methanomicrobia archaeon]
MKLKVEGVEFSYASVEVLKGICVELGESEMLGVVGPNGAGKSTLIRCIDRILTPQRGCVTLNGQDIKKMQQMELARRIGYIPQNSSQVFPATVFDTVLMGRRPHLGWRSSEKDTEKVLEVLELMKIEEFAMRDIHELSGGQQQKVFIARALTQEPDILLLDEPTSNLDIRHQLEVLDVIKEVVRRRGISAVMAIHDLNLASRYADRIVMLNGGRVFAAGEPSAVLTQENIKQAYGVVAEVKREKGRPYIVPLRPVS